MMRKVEEGYCKKQKEKKLNVKQLPRIELGAVRDLVEDVSALKRKG